MVRELDVSKITMRLIEGLDKKGSGEQDHVKSKVTGDTLNVLKSGLVSRQSCTRCGVVLTFQVYASSIDPQGQRGSREQGQSEPAIHTCKDEARPIRERQQHGQPEGRSS